MSLLDEFEAEMSKRGVLECIDRRGYGYSCQTP